jgi:hypothetical protein
VSARQIIRIQPAAPAKPALGQPCNGCGICCLAEPCPVGMLVSRRRHGACELLRWSDAEARYRCGLLAEAQGRAGPLTRLWQAWARRMIAAGSGCDAQLQIEPAPWDKP